MKKFILFFLIIFLFFGSVGFVLDKQLASAQDEKPLEIIYPEIEGFGPETVKTAIPDYVKYIFNFAIWISGFIALGVLIYAGFIYFTSTGNPEKIKDAKERILYAFFGLIILFGSYLILVTINPALITFRLEPIELPPDFPFGILLCKKNIDVNMGHSIARNWEYYTPERQEELRPTLQGILDEISENCHSVTSQTNIPYSSPNIRVTDIYFIPPIIEKEEYLRLYGVILYEEEGFKGRTQVIHKYLSKIYAVEHSESDFPRPGSIKPYEINWSPDQNWEVTLYERPGLNMGFPAEIRENSYSLASPSLYREISLAWSPQSLDIEGDLIVVLLTSDGRSETFFNEIDENLLDNDNIINWVRCHWYSVFKNCAEPAATKLIIISGNIMGD